MSLCRNFVFLWIPKNNWLGFVKKKKKKVRQQQNKNNRGGGRPLCSVVYEVKLLFLSKVSGGLGESDLTAYST